MLAVPHLTNMNPGAVRSVPLLYLLFVLLAAVTEEIIKVLPLVWHKARQQIATKSNALWAGMFLGRGFGIEEICYLAWKISRVRPLSDYVYAVLLHALANTGALLFSMRLWPVDPD